MRRKQVELTKTDKQFRKEVMQEAESLVKWIGDDKEKLLYNICLLLTSNLVLRKMTDD